MAIWFTPIFVLTFPTFDIIFINDFMRASHQFHFVYFAFHFENNIVVTILFAFLCVKTMNKTTIRTEIPSWILSRDCWFFFFFPHSSVVRYFWRGKIVNINVCGAWNMLSRVYVWAKVKDNAIEVAKNCSLQFTMSSYARTLVRKHQWHEN